MKVVNHVLGQSVNHVPLDKTCTLRSWLNNEFLESSFSEVEKAMIPTVTVSADKNPEYNTDPGNATQDKVFLLSITEMDKYFSSDNERICYPTASAGAFTLADNTCAWWLRTPGATQNHAAYSIESIYAADSGNSGSSVNYYSIGVRPALWIDLTA